MSNLLKVNVRCGECNCKINEYVLWGEQAVDAWMGRADRDGAGQKYEFTDRGGAVEYEICGDCREWEAKKNKIDDDMDWGDDGNEDWDEPDVPAPLNQ